MTYQTHCIQTTLITLTLCAPVWIATAAAAQSLANLPVEDAQVVGAQVEGAPAEQSANGAARLKSWQLGGIASYGHYSEHGLMQLQGPRSGVSAARQLRPYGAWEIAIQGQLQLSAMRYSSPISGELSNVPDLETDLRITAQYPLSSTSADAPDAWQWSAYAGLAYRLHYNDLRGFSSLGSIGYRRLNQRIYAPVGLQVTRPSASALSARLEFTPALYGTHRSYMSDVGADRDATAVQQSSGWGLEIGWLAWPDWRLSAHHRQWSTTATDPWASTRFGMTRRYYEPASQWRETGLQLRRQF